jgi:hypothetical protein
MSTHSPLSVRDIGAASLSTDRRMGIEIAPRLHRCLQPSFKISFSVPRKIGTPVSTP